MGTKVLRYASSNLNRREKMKTTIIFVRNRYRKRISRLAAELITLNKSCLQSTHSHAPHRMGSAVYSRDSTCPS